jgi:hypothetical protein
MAEAGIKASITAAIVANLITAFLCFKVGKSAGYLSSAWPLGKVRGEHITWAAPLARPIIAIRIARAYRTLFLSSLIL